MARTSCLANAMCFTLRFYMSSLPQLLLFKPAFRYGQNMKRDLHNTWELNFRPPFLRQI